MADNVAVTAGTGTSIAADEVTDGTLGSVKVQFVKMMDGTLDSTNKLIVDSAGAASVRPTVNEFLVSGNFTRPADTTAYAANDLVANSTTAGSVVPVSLSLARSNAGYGHIYWLRMFSSSGTVTNAQFRWHFYNGNVTCANGDNGAWSTNAFVSGAPIYLGSMDVTVNKTFTDGIEGEGYATVGTGIPFQAPAGATTINAVCQALAAWTPGNASIITVAVGGDFQ